MFINFVAQRFTLIVPEVKSVCLQAIGRVNRLLIVPEGIEMSQRWGIPIVEDLLIVPEGIEM